MIPSFLLISIYSRVRVTVRRHTKSDLIICKDSTEPKLVNRITLNNIKT